MNVMITVGEDETTIAIGSTVLEPGDVMDDGTVYAGASPDTGMPMYTTPADAPLAYTFNEARKYAKSLNAHSHEDWRIPSKAELNEMWKNRDKGALKGTFNLNGSSYAGWYWSSSPIDGRALWTQCFSDGEQNWARVLPTDAISLRCVR